MTKNNRNIKLVWDSDKKNVEKADLRAGNFKNQLSLFPVYKENVLYVTAISKGNFIQVIEDLYEIRPSLVLETRLSPRFNYIQHGRKMFDLALKTNRIYYHDLLKITGCDEFGFAAASMTYIFSEYWSRRESQLAQMSGPVFLIGDARVSISDLADEFTHNVKLGGIQNWQVYFSDK